MEINRDTIEINGDKVEITPTSILPSNGHQGEEKSGG